MRKILLRLLSVVFSCLLCNASAMADEILHYTSDTLGVQAERGAAAGQYELRLSSPGSAESDFKVFALEDPARLVIDVTGSKHSKQQKVVAESNSLIKSMRTGKHPDKLRVVFDLAGSKVPDYSTSFAKGVMNVQWGAVIGQVASKPQERTKKPQAVKPLTVAKVAAPVSKNQSRQPVKKQLAKKVRITHQGKQAATPKSNWVTEKVERERLIKSDGRSNWVTKPVPAADKVRADRNHRLIVTNQGLVRKRREQKERSDPGPESHSVEKV